LVSLEPLAPLRLPKFLIIWLFPGCDRSRPSLHRHLHCTHSPFGGCFLGWYEDVDLVSLDGTAGISCNCIAIPFHKYNGSERDYIRVDCNYFCIWIFFQINPGGGNPMSAGTFNRVGCCCYGKCFSVCTCIRFGL